MTPGDVVIDDHLPGIHPSNLEGQFGTVGGGLVAGRLGIGCTGYQMGSELSPGVTPGVVPCSSGGKGLDVSASIMWGKSKLVDVKWEKCNSCEAVNSPFKGN